MIAECEAVISGPLNEEGRAPWWLTVLEINETHPAIVRCQVTCLDQQGFYRPAMALIITSQEQFKAVYYNSLTTTTDGAYSKILLGNVSSLQKPRRCITALSWSKLCAVLSSCTWNNLSVSPTM